MIDECTNNLEEIKDLINGLNQIQYQKELVSLNNSTVGKHIRHIVEFYICLFEGIENKSVNYDNRKRDIRLEQDIKFTINKINEIIVAISLVNKDSNLTMESNFSINNNNKIKISTSLYRELAYCLEHSIHHQAIIKIGLCELKLENLISNSFGIAPSTLRFNKY